LEKYYGVYNGLANVNGEIAKEGELDDQADMCVIVRTLIAHSKMFVM
jgi:hypothetical protein